MIMAAGIGQQIENAFECECVTDFGAMPWRQVSSSHRIDKTLKHRRERRRARSDVECDPQYRRYREWEF